MPSPLPKRNKTVKEWLPDGCLLFPSHRDVHFNRNLGVQWRDWGPQEPPGRCLLCPISQVMPWFWFEQLAGESELSQGEARSRGWRCSWRNGIQDEIWRRSVASLSKRAVSWISEAKGKEFCRWVHWTHDAEGLAWLTLVDSNGKPLVFTLQMLVRGEWPGTGLTRISRPRTQMWGLGAEFLSCMVAEAIYGLLWLGVWKATDSMLLRGTWISHYL